MSTMTMIAGGRETRPIDRHLPSYDITSSFHRVVDAPVPTTVAAISRLDLMAPFVEALTALGLGHRLLLSQAAVVGDAARGHLVFGLIWKFDEHSFPGFRSAEDFAGFSAPRHAKLAWEFTVETHEDGRSLLSTTLRVAGTDTVSRQRLRDSWRVLGALTEAHSRRMLDAVKRYAEDAAEENADLTAPVVRTVTPVRPHLRVVV